jgi:hypothetical protein
MFAVLSIFVILNIIGATQPYWAPTNDDVALIIAALWNFIGILISLIVQAVTLKT